MTRLTVDWVADIASTIKEYDADFKEKSGMDLLELAGVIAEKNHSQMKKILKDNKAAVIRSNTGQGVISGFDSAVASILKQIGIETVLCKDENVSGINEAVNAGANILFMADDDKFIALNILNEKKSDNDYATALGFVTVLEKMAGGLNDQSVLLLGYGKVGRVAADLLTKKGALVHIYEKRHIFGEVDGKYGGLVDSLDRISEYKYIFDATNEGGWITNDIPIKDAFIVSPGVPLSFDLDHFQKNNKIVYDMLQIGTAVMLAEVI